MIKRFLSVFLCGMMLICLVACAEEQSPDEVISSSQETENTETAVFNTEGITCVTFYAYYGGGKGSEVPSEYMNEIITWLGSFTMDEKVSDVLLPGTNTYYIEIEYSDGTVIKNGLDAIEVDGTAYYLKSDKKPECFEEIISKTSLE